MSARSEVSPRAQQSTINAISSEILPRVGRDSRRRFRLGEPDSGRTLRVVNYPVAPWRRHFDLRLGREVHLIVEERKVVHNEGDTTVNTTETRYRVDTRRRRPAELRIDAAGPQQYPDTDTGLRQHHAALAERSYIPERQRWTNATETQAQELLTRVKSITEDPAN